MINQTNSVEKTFIQLFKNNKDMYKKSGSSDTLKKAVNFAFIKHHITIKPEVDEKTNTIYLQNIDPRTPEKYIVGSYIIEKNGSFEIYSLSDNGYEEYEKFIFSNQLIKRLSKLN